jgi:hypothetical protein
VEVIDGACFKVVIVGRCSKAGGLGSLDRLLVFVFVGENEGTEGDKDSGVGK